MTNHGKLRHILLLLTVVIFSLCICQPVSASSAGSCYSCSTRASGLRDDPQLEMEWYMIHQLIDIHQPITDDCYKPINRSLTTTHNCNAHQGCMKYSIDYGAYEPYVLRGCADRLFKNLGVHFEWDNITQCRVKHSTWKAETCMCHTALCNAATTADLQITFVILFICLLYLKLQ